MNKCNSIENNNLENPKPIVSIINGQKYFDDINIRLSGENSFNSYTISDIAVDLVSEVETKVDNNDLLIKHIEHIAEDISKSYRDLKEEFKERENRISENQMKLEDRIDSKIDKLLEELKEKEKRQNKIFDDQNKKLDKLDNTKFWVLGVGLTLIIGIGGMVWAAFNSFTTLYAPLFSAIQELLKK